MDIAKAKKALKQIAKREGVSVDMVRHEIKIAIETASKSPDPAAHSFWMSVPHTGKSPTPEEVIVYIADMVKNQ